MTQQDQPSRAEGDRTLTIRHTAAHGLQLLGVGGHGPLAVAAVGMAADDQAAVPLPADTVQLLWGREGETAGQDQGDGPITRPARPGTGPYVTVGSGEAPWRPPPAQAPPTWLLRQWRSTRLPRRSQTTMRPRL